MSNNLSQPVVHNTDFYLHLMRFLMTAKQHVVAVSADYDLTSMQAVTLLLLPETGGMPMSQLGRLFGCDASNVTGLVDGLERKGLVSRQERPEDRRSKLIRLETEGKKLREAVLAQITFNSDYLFAPLDQEESDQFIRIIRKLAAASSLPL